MYYMFHKKKVSCIVSDYMDGDFRVSSISTRVNTYNAVTF